jgi:hypothetical protein
VKRRRWTDLFCAFVTGEKSEDFVTQRDCAASQPIGAGQLEHGGNFASVHDFW